MPTLLLAAWARPVTRRGSLLGPVLHFAVPAALAVAVAGFGTYVGYFVVLGQTAAQTALTVVSIWCGLLLVVLVEPPTPWWTGGDVLAGDRRPALLFAIFATTLVVTPLREFFDLTALGLSDCLLLAAVTGVWLVVVHHAWRARVLERLLA
jgi:cation-transporting ATPase E